MPLKDDSKHAEDHMKHAADQVRDAAKQAADAGGKSVKKMVDAAHEAEHHAAAVKERENRELLGSQLSPGAEANSVAREISHDAKAMVAGVKKKLDEL